MGDRWTIAIETEQAKYEFKKERTDNKEITLNRTEITSPDGSPGEFPIELIGKTTSKSPEEGSLGGPEYAGDRYILLNDRTRKQVRLALCRGNQVVVITAPLTSSSLKAFSGK